MTAVDVFLKDKVGGDQERFSTVAKDNVRWQVYDEGCTRNRRTICV